MIVKLILKGGLGLGGAPLVVEVAQMIAYRGDGTPIACAAEYGPAGALAVSMAGEADFNRMLRNLGEGMTVMCDNVRLSEPPQGARLVAGPKPFT